MTEDTPSERASAKMGAGALMDERQPRILGGGEPRSLARIGRSQTFIIDKDPTLPKEAGIKLPSDGPPMPVPRSTAPSVPAAATAAAAATATGVSSERRRLGRRQLSLSTDRPALTTTRAAKSLSELGQSLQAVEGRRLPGTSGTPRTPGTPGTTGTPGTPGKQDGPDSGRETLSVSRRVAATPETPDTQTTPKVTPVPAPRRRRRFDAIETSGTQAEARENENTAPQDEPPAPPPSADKGPPGTPETPSQLARGQSEPSEPTHPATALTGPPEVPGENDDQLTAPTATPRKHGLASGSGGVTGRRLLLKRQKTLADGSSPATDPPIDEPGEPTVRRQASDSGKGSPPHGGIVVVADVHMPDELVVQAEPPRPEPPAALSATVEYEAYEEPGEDATSTSQQSQTKNGRGKESPQRKTDSPPRPPRNEEQLGSEAQKDTLPGENSRLDPPGNEKERRGQLPKGSPLREMGSGPQSPSGRGHPASREAPASEPATGGNEELLQQPDPLVKEPSPGKRPPDAVEAFSVPRDETLSESRERLDACKPYPVTKRRQSLPPETRARLQDVIKRGLERQEHGQGGPGSRDELDRQLQETAAALRDFCRAPALGAELIGNYENMLERCRKTRDALLSGREVDADTDESANPQLAESCRHALYWLRPLTGPSGPSPEVPVDVLSFLLCPDIRTRPINNQGLTERKIYV